MDRPSLDPTYPISPIWSYQTMESLIYQGSGCEMTHSSTAHNTEGMKHKTPPGSCFGWGGYLRVDVGWVTAAVFPTNGELCFHFNLETIQR